MMSDLYVSVLSNSYRATRFEWAHQFDEKYQ